MSAPQEAVFASMAGLIRAGEPFALAILADIVRERRRGARGPLGQSDRERASSTPKTALADAIHH